MRDRDQRLREIRERAEYAASNGGPFDHDEDHDLIIEDVPWLLAEVERLRQELGVTDVSKSWPNGAPEWRLRRWTARPASIGQHWIAGNERTILIEDASDCHDLIRVLQEVHNEMCRREANPGTTDRKGWRP